MNKIFLLFLIGVSGFTAHCQQVEIIKLNHLEKILTSTEHDVLVVNFWATWCAPCVKELPLFDSLHDSRINDLKVLLVSLDYADKVETVKNFINRKNVRSEVVLLDEVDYDSWIDKVEPSWQGAIPATLVLNTKTGHRKFIAKQLVDGDLEKIIDEVSKP